MKKLGFKDWEEHCKAIEQSTSIMPDEPLKVRLERIERAKNDYQFFFEYYFPKFAKAPCAWYHIVAANAIADNERIRFLAEWYRGAAKSTHFILGIPLWLAIRGENMVMVVVGKSEKAAQRVLGSLQAQLQFNQRFKQDFGDWYNHGNWSDGEFVTNNGHAFYAIGLGQSPRGTRNEADRPTYIAVSDADSKKLSKNPRLVKEACEWIKEDLLPTTDVGAARFILENNRFSKHSIMGTFSEEKFKGSEKVSLKKVKGNTNAALYKRLRNWYHLRVNAIDVNGVPSWPEKYTAKYWQDMQDDCDLLTWMREYMNTPIVQGKHFKKEFIRYGKMLPLKEYDALVVYIDTSYKATINSDYKALVFIGRKQRQLHLIKTWIRRASVKLLAQALYDLYESIPASFRDTVSYYIEANFIQDMQLEDFDVEGDDRGYYVPIVGDTRHKPEKLSRIIAMAPTFERLWWTFNEDEQNSPDMQRMEEQLLAIEEGSSTPDDGPDALEGGKWQLDRRVAKASSEPKAGEYERKNRY